MCMRDAISHALFADRKIDIDGEAISTARSTDTTAYNQKPPSTPPQSRAIHGTTNVLEAVA